MDRPIYNELISSEDVQTFYFDSEGRHGIIRKAVVYTSIKELSNTYNLGFGTLKRNSTGELYIDGRDKTNNGDINLVLSTVAKTIEIYLMSYPERKIFFKGYTPQLTKVYQRAIRANFDLLITKYKIFGNIDYRENFYNLQDFDPAVNYYGFLIETF